jgi:hypothetical protein
MSGRRRVARRTAPAEAVGAEVVEALEGEEEGEGEEWAEEAEEAAEEAAEAARPRARARSRRPFPAPILHVLGCLPRRRVRAPGRRRPATSDRRGTRLRADSRRW